MAGSGTGARQGAMALLGAVLGDGLLMSDALDRLDRYPPAERARAQRLAAETLRMLSRADRILSDHLQRMPPLFVRNALRLGTVELCQGAAAHGVVHDLVSLVGGHRKHQRLKGLTNAVLRKVAADGPPVWDRLPVPRLPKNLRTRLIRAFGTRTVTAMEAVQAQRPPLDLTPRGDAAALAERLDGTALPTGSVRLPAGVQVSALEGYADGAFWVQDAAAALPAAVLAAQPGETVLDMCAAPGGKTLQLAATGARVTAVDRSPSRMALVAENLARTGLSADLVTADARSHDGRYDAILLDAPCSATGTIRRHPDLPFVKVLDDLAGLTALQAEMLDHGWRLLRPGGRLVFCTCSLLPEEGEAQLAGALRRWPDARLVPGALDLPGIDPDWHAAEGGLRLRPDFWADRGGIDGFFIACLAKTG
ncbi:MAG: RsmB/NOP family class I SAM-dependent RNA methyltransferase [Marinibacterium sp.]